MLVVFFAILVDELCIQIKFSSNCHTDSGRIKIRFLSSHEHEMVLRYNFVGWMVDPESVRKSNSYHS